jgi:hypothetical protein
MLDKEELKLCTKLVKLYTRAIYTNEGARGVVQLSSRRSPVGNLPCYIKFDTTLKD